MLLIPLEKLYTNRDSVRKAREAFLIHRGNTLEPEEMKCNASCTLSDQSLHYFYISSKVDKDTMAKLKNVHIDMINLHFDVGLEYSNQRS